MAKKFSIGRQKIKIAKIERKNHLQVTFSKRRSGLFKKASELCTLCGVEIAIIVFSPAGKVFSFGHPNVEGIIDRFFGRNPPPSNSSTLHLVEAHRSMTVCELNFHLTQIFNELEGERKRGEALDDMRQASQSQFWWESPVEKMGFDELQQLKDCMEALKKNVNNQANSILIENANSNFPPSGFNGHRAFNQFEAKPNQIDPASHVPGYGYGNGYFGLSNFAA
ncbi:agamous-like MADS-box protein AGL62 [Apium graveolens]|uniref:agamous-like MADS-box protein AGL62 n=1 Tax=Apium graveolens TaxID=4045 RepID=UPI003D78FCE1